MKTTEVDRFDLEGYLGRIGMDRPRRPDRETLDRLMYAQQSHIPYENSSVYYDTEPVRLDPDSLYRKMVIRRRGGYCFELNGLFTEALRQLGFTAYSCFCRVQKGAAQIQPIRHRGTIVELEQGAVFCDVGYGSVLCPRSLDLKTGYLQKVREGTYRFEPAGQGWWNLHYRPGPVRDEAGNVSRPEEQVELMVCLSSAEPEDFEVYNQITSTASDSVFKRHRRLHRLTEEGGIGYMDGRLTIVEKGRVRTVWVDGFRQECQMLHEWFGIPVEEFQAFRR